MHDQWEYKLLTGHGLRQNLRDAEGVEYGRWSQELLNRLGKEGWEVCSHSWGSGFTVATLVNRDTAQGAFPGIVGYNPAVDPFSPDGLQYSNITFSGPFVPATTAAL